MRKTILIILIISAFLFAGCQGNKKTAERKSEPIVIVNGDDTLVIPSLGKYSKVTNIPPRFQWDSNGGYCGEVSMISAGLYYGQYLSQYAVRAIASPGVPQNYLGSQLLLGKNDAAAASRLRLQYQQWDSNIMNHDSFLAWVKMHVLQGHPVIIGVYTNEYEFYGDSNPVAGDPEYDHIVPVIGFGSKHDFKANNKKYFPDDMILFSDNGLLGNDGDIPMKDSVPYYYNYSLDSFLATRKEANDSNGNPYSLAGGKHTRNYGIAITGIMDKESETLPVSISTDCNYEAPEIKVSQQPKPISLALNITVSNLRPHTKYNLYYYTDEKDVPVEKFNKNSKQKPWKHINIDSGTIYTTKLSIDSDKKVFLRAVPADGE